MIRVEYRVCEEIDGRRFSRMFNDASELIKWAMGGNPGVVVKLEYRGVTDWEEVDLAKVKREASNE